MIHPLRQLALLFMLLACFTPAMAAALSPGKTPRRWTVLPRMLRVTLRRTSSLRASPTAWKCRWLTRLALLTRFQ